ncbi:MAG: Nif3-like dinuclear metal center hexameric protein [Methanoregulaceae archaeon]|jgi:putative NIF3 family GTP cyclohydrolase 1 type 2|nr:Nif3-like dinuclear metal center hexameric protein [Methanoregulaceae archaeon]
MDISAVIRNLEEIAPPAGAEVMDAGRIGLIIEGKPEIGRVVCALDATPAVVSEALRIDADMLIVHHTPLWSPVTSVSRPLGSFLKQVLGSDLNIYVMHTNFDHAKGGINDTLADLLGLASVAGMTLGVCGNCSLDIPGLVSRLGSPLRTWGLVQLPCRIGVAGGSGFDLDLIREAASLGARAYLSSELKLSVARSSPLPLIESTHYALEAPGMRRLAERMGWQFIDDPPVMATWM